MLIIVTIGTEVFPVTAIGRVVVMVAVPVMDGQQVQIFTPLPSTTSALMYWTEINPITGRKIYVEKDLAKKQRQKDIVVGKTIK